MTLPLLAQASSSTGAAQSHGRKFSRYCPEYRHTYRKIKIFFNKKGYKSWAAVSHVTSWNLFSEKSQVICTRPGLWCICLPVPMTPPGFLQWYWYILATLRREMDWQGDGVLFSHVTRTGENGFKLQWRGSDWVIGKISSPKELSSTGTGCPGKSLSHHPWRYLKDVVVALEDMV